MSDKKEYVVIVHGISKPRSYSIELFRKGKKGEVGNWPDEFLWQIAKKTEGWEGSNFVFNVPEAIGVTRTFLLLPDNVPHFELSELKRRLDCWDGEKSSLSKIVETAMREIEKL